jgi:hypothetical protein
MPNPALCVKSENVQSPGEIRYFRAEKNPITGHVTAWSARLKAACRNSRKHRLKVYLCDPAFAPARVSFLTMWDCPLFTNECGGGRFQKLY